MLREASLTPTPLTARSCRGLGEARGCQGLGKLLSSQFHSPAVAVFYCTADLGSQLGRARRDRKQKGYCSLQRKEGTADKSFSCHLRQNTFQEADTAQKLTEIHVWAFSQALRLNNWHRQGSDRVISLQQTRRKTMTGRVFS